MMLADEVLENQGCLWISHLSVLTTSRLIPHFVAAYFIDWIYIYIKSWQNLKFYPLLLEICSQNVFVHLRKSRVGLSAGASSVKSIAKHPWVDEKSTQTPETNSKFFTWKWSFVIFLFGALGRQIFRGVVFSLLVSGSVGEFSSPKRNDWTDPVLKTLLKGGRVLRYNPPRAPL